MFEIREFEKTIDIVEDLRKLDLESCCWYYYSFASLIASQDFHYVKRLVTKSKILSDKSICYLIDPNDANYNTIFNLHSDLFQQIGPCLILINFNNELINETFNKNIDEQYMLIRFFDLLNLLFEYGVDDEIIQIFEKTIETIYEIPLD